MCEGQDVILVCQHHLHSSSTHTAGLNMQAPSYLLKTKHPGSPGVLC
jgi:hypothetical protein